MELKAEKPQKKDNKPCPAHAYNVEALRDQEMDIARHAEQVYDQFVAQSKTRLKVRARSRLAGLWDLTELAAGVPLFGTESPAHRLPNTIF